MPLPVVAGFEEGAWGGDGPDQREACRSAGGGTGGTIVIGGTTYVIVPGPNGHILAPINGGGRHCYCVC
ncbi:hypothetical protein [Streptosporangium sp. NPDC051022]|uniref:hypothetical protein n=1 Tax=Streptosporangium sp. NPDC051022 TaxID=3155752 RepID=UPI00342A51ED